MAAATFILVSPAEPQTPLPQNTIDLELAERQSARTARADVLSLVADAQHFSTAARSTRGDRRLAVLNMRIAELHGSEDPRAEHRFAQAAGHLYRSSDPIGARNAYVRAAEHAANRGDVIAAAHYYVDVAWVISRHGQRTPQDMDAARVYAAKAKLLVNAAAV
jgi:hypothetical protein